MPAVLFREVVQELVTPAVPATDPTDVFQLQLVCGWYPTAPLLAAVQALAPTFGFSYNDAYRTALGARLNYSQLTQNPPMPEGDKAAVRDGYFSGGGIAPFFPYNFVCAHFSVPVVVPGEAEVPAVYRSVLTPGWDASAVSIKTFLNSGLVKFRVGPGFVGIVGLQDGPNPTDPSTRFAGLWFSGDAVTDVWREVGSTADHVTEISRAFYDFVPYGSGAVFTIQVRRYKGVSTLTVTRDQHGIIAPLFSYELPPSMATTAVYSLGAVIFGPDDWVEGIEVRQLEGTGDEGDAGQLPALQGEAGGTYRATRSEGRLPALRGTGRVAVGGAATLPALLGVGGRAYGQAITAMLPLQSSGGVTFVAPAGAPRSSGRLPALRGSGSGLARATGTGAALLVPLAARGGQGTLSEGYAALPALGALGLGLSGLSVAMFTTTGAETSSSAQIGLFLSFSEAVGVDTQIGAAIVQAANMTSTVTADFLVQTQQDLFAVMNSLVTVNAGEPPSSQPAAVWAMNLANAAVSTYEGYNFNSFAKINGRYYGARDDGIYLLEGGTDDGAPIRASISFGKQDFGTRTVKNMGRAYIGASSTGQMFLKITAEGQSYIYKARDASSEIQQQRFDVGRGLKATYFTFELFNNEGGDFELDNVSFIAADFVRRV